MNRHLLPNEIDLLLDGDAGFGTQPLAAHVRHCRECSSELERARALVRDLEHLPHFAPSVAVGERVLARVQVFVPWQVALVDVFRGWMPRSTPMRVLAGAGLAGSSVVLSLATVWLLARMSLVSFVVDLGVKRARDSISESLLNLLGLVLGERVVAAVHDSGLFGLMLAVLLLLLLAAAMIRGLGTLVAATRRPGRR